MDETYSKFLLMEYNRNFAPYIIDGCNCYSCYDNFKEYVFEKNNSYLCCIVVSVGNTYKILHKKWPIMLGSRIDLSIRKSTKESNLFGCFIIDGCVKMIYNFITNNLTNGHVYVVKNGKLKHKVFMVKIKWGDLALNLTYDPEASKLIDYTIYDEQFVKNESLKRKFKSVETLYETEKVAIHSKKRQKLNPSIEKSFTKTKNLYENDYNATLLNSAKDMTWVDFINNASDEKETYTEEEYIEYFKACLMHAPNLDDLANKTCLSPNTILLRVLKYQLLKVKNDKQGTINSRFTSMANKLITIIKNGNMFFVLSHKMTEANIMTDYKSIYQVVDAQKLHLASALSSTVKRSINNKTKNSKALFFPDDGYQYTCTVDTKDIKGAGENISLAQLVISPKGIDSKTIKQIFKNPIIQNAKLEDEGDKLLTLVINSFITSYRIPKSKLILLKNICPILNLMVYDRFININTNGHVLMKYSCAYKFFVNPYELKHLWPDAFDDCHEHLKYNPCIMYLPSYIDLAQPAKRNVANSNVKGRCTMLTTRFNIHTFIHSVGASNAALIHREEEDDEIIETSLTKTCTDKLKVPVNLKDPHLRYLKFAEHGVEPIPEALKELFAVYKPIDDGTECNGMALDDIIDDAKGTFTEMFKKIDDWNADNFMLTFNTEKAQKFKTKDDYFTLTVKYHNILTDDEMPVNASQQIVSSKKQNCLLMRNANIKKLYEKKLNFDTSIKHPPHLVVYTAFGDFQGGTNEDGIIIDKSLVEHGPKKLISQTLNIKFTETVKVLKRNKPIMQLLEYTPINNTIDNVIAFGVIMSNTQMTVTKSKNIKIKESRIRSLYRYFIFTEISSAYEKVIESFFCKETNRVNIHLRYIVPIGVGMKISNRHGQKGIISAVADLSHIKAYRSDGTVVHPQLLYAATSIVGRTVASQVYSMHAQKDAAFTEDGLLIAPHGINIHHIEASIKSKYSLVKNDLMTVENGFISNSLNFVSKKLQDQRSLDKDKHPLHLVQQLWSLQGIQMKFLSFNNEIIEELE